MTTGRQANQTKSRRGRLPQPFWHSLPALAFLAASTVVAQPEPMGVPESEDLPGVALQTMGVPEGEDLVMRVVVAVEEVGVGEGFLLAVVRRWRKGLRPVPWREHADVDALAPLRLRFLGKDRREMGPHIQETFRYMAYAFVCGSVVVPGLRMTAEPDAGGATVDAKSKELRLSVHSVLPKAGGKDIELPGPPFSAPLPWRKWLLFGWLGLGVIALLARYANGKRIEQAAETEPHTPEEKALQVLTELKQNPPRDPLGAKDAARRASHMLRSFLSERYDLQAQEMTTEEIAKIRSFPATITGKHRNLVLHFLAQCDSLKFARQTQSEEERQHLLSNIEAFIRLTCAAAPPEPEGSA